MKTKAALLIVAAYALTAGGNLVLAAEGDLWPLRLLCAFGFGYLAVRQYRKHTAAARA